MVINEVKINGRVYNYEAKPTSTNKIMSRFGLQFYNGKKDGKSTYAFINCKGFEDFGLEDRQDVIVTGTIRENSWLDQQGNKKGGEKEIFVSSVEPNEIKGNAFSDIKDDSIPF
jgi:hypothetical protein